MAAAFVVVVAWFSSFGLAAAQRSHAVVFDQAQGLDAGEISALAQDSAGFIWIGTNGGLIRYDGRRFVRWAPRDVRGLAKEVVAGPGGEVIVLGEFGEGLVVSGDRAKPLAGPDGHEVKALKAAAFDRQGRLWAVIGQALWTRTAANRWASVPAGATGGEVPLRLSPLERGVGVMTAQGAWVLRDPDRAGVRLMRGTGLLAMAETAGDRIWIATRNGAGLWLSRNGRVESVGRPPGRLISMTVRDGALWASIDQFLLSIDADGRRRVQGQAQGILGGGPLLVDREGGLWLGTFVNLMHFPEPDTLQWTEAEGLPINHLHGVAQAGGEIWINSWRGAARVPADGSDTRLRREAWTDGNLCTDRAGGVWLASHGRLLHWRAGGYHTVQAGLLGPDFYLAGCAEAGSDAVLLATGAGAYRARTDGASAERVRAGLHGRTGVDAVWRGADGAVWLADDAEACRFPGGDVASEPAACERLPPSTAMTAGVEVAPGVEWLPLSSGLVEIAGDRLRTLPGNASLPGSAIQRLEPAPSGGWWAFGPGVFLRIAPCGGCADGWRVLEAPGAGLGLPGNSALDAVETAGGDLWVTGNRGLFHIPAAARSRAAKPERLALVAVSVDGRPVDFGRALRLAPDQHRLELNFAAPSYRDPARLVYRYRLSQAAPWSGPTTEATLQLIDQAPGRYRAEMQASTDGRTWTAPARLDFSVAAPWWMSWPARLVYGLVLIGVLWLAYHLRVRHLLSLQRQRLAIAMDLHDELGSSLSSIGALARAAGRSSITPGDRSRLADEIATAAQFAGAGLRSLVWTMREDAIDAASFGREIADQARRLAPQAPPRIAFDLPKAEGGPRFDAQVRRQVLMVLLEAVHNAVRHSHAEVIRVSLTPFEAAWRLEVADDGGGFDCDLETAGSGLESMRQRAQKVGGRLQISSTPGQGTRMSLTFEAARTRRELPVALWRTRLGMAGRRG